MTKNIRFFLDVDTWKFFWLKVEISSFRLFTSLSRLSTLELSTLAAVVVDADDDAGDADSQLFFGAADVDAAAEENEFLLDDEDDDSSSDVGLDFEVSEAAVEEGVEVVSEIFPSEEDPAFQLGVCFFQAGWAASFGFSSTGARVDLADVKKWLF